MVVTIVLGAQFGDEGKGKITDLLSQSATLCCRSAGGHNAGHTIVHDNITYDFHILPSGLISPTCINLIGTGTVVHLPSFFKELDALQAKGLKGADQRIFISDRAHVCFDLHSVVDGLEEAILAGKKVGTTGKGIGPCYSDKAARRGVRIGEVLEEGVVESKLRALEAGYRRRFGELQYDLEEEVKRFNEYRTKLQPFVVDQMAFMQKHKSSPCTLVEGANALMLDIDHGTYPYVTSSCTGLGGAIQGLTLNPTSITSVVGVVKAYSTRVGSGPFPTEQLNAAGEKLQTTGREFGVTTGRRRRCGWLDMVMCRYSNAINHYTAINLTKLDILDDFDEVKVAVAYKLDGKRLESFPAQAEVLDRVEVEYVTFPGWKSNTMGATKWEDLPTNAQRYVQFIEREMGGVPVKWIGTGPARSHMIEREL
ncbi:adenylosuccinate synthetase [Helicocarpus griseus UAMH5409]|uniref:Adenylosuccinate synthetase n=1 Tax=Helicocarpus griseus UAMH5409 TaxID=1447875 RepID=A0A2B7XJT9_9EURO|nr:adenylosuccinate synthetase [Helicocarpus griseus UAMH5409]